MGKKTRVRKKMVWDERGVSEIIADILILSMTVVLFAVIFAFVWSMPAPDESTYAEFDSDLKLFSDGGRINITHESGEDLTGGYTEIFIFKNLEEEVRQLNTKGDMDPYGDNPDGYGLEEDSTWSAGERWTYFLGGLSLSDDVEVKIVDMKFGSLIMSAKLLGTALNSAPIIMERWYNPNPAVNGGDMTVYAKVMDPNGYTDIESVSVNVKALNISCGTLEMTDSDHDGIFETTFKVNASGGTYAPTIYAKDKDNHIDSGRVSVRVQVDNKVKPVIAMASAAPNVVPVHEEFIVQAYIFDPDDDLNTESVYVDMSAIGQSSKTMDPTSNPGVFQAVGTASGVKGTYTLIVYASDHTGHEATADVPITIVNIEGIQWIYDGTWNASLGNIPKGSSGPEGDYGYGIYNVSNQPSIDDPGGNETRIFINHDDGTGDDHVVVVVRSTTLKNTFRINSFIMYDSHGNKIFEPVDDPITSEYDSLDPAKNTPAFRQTKTFPFFEFIYDFYVTGFESGVYPVFFQLKDNAGNPALTVNDAIYITEDYTIPAYPRIETFKDPNRDGNLSDLEPSDSFIWLDKIYVRLTFADRDSTTTFITKNSGDIEIEDLFTRFPVKRRPGNEPVSNITKWEPDWGSPPPDPTKCYVFNFDLIRKNQDPWVPGTNWYTIRTRLIMDEGMPGTEEIYQMLSLPVEITTPSSTLDVVTSTEGDKETSGTYWYENGDYWDEHIVDSPPKQKKPLALATGDVNGDTLIDIVVGLDEDKRENIYLYINENYGESFRRYFISNFEDAGNKYKAQALTIADLDGDGDGDIVAGVKGKDKIGAIIFWNDGGWTTQILDAEEGHKGEVNCVAVGDINQDGRPDIVTGDKDKKIHYYRNNVRGAFLPPVAQNGDYTPLDASCFDLGMLMGTAGDDIMENSLRLGQMEGIAYDLNPSHANADDTLDVVVVNKDKNLYIFTTEVFANESVVFHKHEVDLSTKIPKKIMCLDLGDFNGDNMIDIVIGLDHKDDKSNVFRLRNNGLDGDPHPNSANPHGDRHNWVFREMTALELQHTITNPLDGKLLKMGKVFDISVGDVDFDGDLDIVFCGDEKNEMVGNLFWFRNDGDADESQWTELAIDTNSFNNKKEKVYAVELDYIDL